MKFTIILYGIVYGGVDCNFSSNDKLDKQRWTTMDEFK